MKRNLFFFRLEAGKSLAKISSRQEEGGEIAIDALIATLKNLKNDKYAAILRMDIMELFKKIGGKKAVDILAALLRQDEEPESGIRALAAFTLGEIGDPKATDALTQAALSDPSDYVRTWATRSLEKIRDKEKAQKELSF